MPVTLMVAIGKAALNVAGAGLIGDAAEIGKAAWNYWKKSPEERLDELEAVVRADDAEVERAAEDVAAEVAGGEPEPVRVKLASFLKQVPSRIRQSQRRPADPSGRTIRPGLVVSRPEDLIAFVPDRLPRFQAGERPIPGMPWVLDELLGIGGFGEVWKARHAHLQSRAPVALKFCTDPLAQRVLRHEARVIDRLMLQAQGQGLHPGIVALQDANLDSDPPFLLYDYVEGGDLGGLIGDWHRQAAKPTAANMARHLLDLAEIVAFAHRLEPPIVHRDLKPANILVQRSRSGETAFRVTDFGIGGIATARVIQASHVPTSPSQFLSTALRGSGTFLYASPEQLRGLDPDPRDDVHALGVIWHQMLTGDLTEGRPSGSLWRDELVEQGMPAEMVKLLESCFEKPRGRPADAGVLAERLGGFVGVRVEPVKSDKPGKLADREPTRAVETPEEIVNSIGMKLRLIPAGEFLMGSPDSDPDAQNYEKPRHRVRITRPFYLGAYLVTRGQFRRFVDEAGYQGGLEKYDDKRDWQTPGFEQTDEHPVVNVSWHDAVAFCEWLSRKEGRTYRLPTEAEWEYACRAGTTTRYSFREDSARLEDHAWFAGNGRNGTNPVGQKPANPWGLFDMHGHVWEWCQDGLTPGFYQWSPPDDPLAPDGELIRRMIRGGSWRGSARSVRSASRFAYVPEDRVDHQGFRCCEVPSVR